MSFVTRLLIASSISLPLMGTAFADEHDHHVSKLGDLRVIHAWTRATSGGDTLVFAEIENGSDKTVTLEGGESDIAAAVQLVGFQLKDGEPSYVELPSVPVAAGTELHLEPEGLALRLSGLTRPLQKGEEFEMEIEFDIGHAEIHVAVEAADAKNHSHAGHIHND